MRIPEWLRRRLLASAKRHMERHPMDRRIPPDPNVRAYMHRWWKWRHARFTSCYINNMLRSDDDRALHDHPWWNISIVLEGGYYEHFPAGSGQIRRVWRAPGEIIIRRKATYLHRLELPTERYAAGGVLGDPAQTKWEEIAQPALSLFITGPRRRRWGFMDPVHGWIDATDWQAHCERMGIESSTAGRVPWQIDTPN